MAIDDDRSTLGAPAGAGPLTMPPAVTAAEARRDDVVLVTWAPTIVRSECLAVALDARSEGMPWAEARGPLLRSARGWVRSTRETLRIGREVPDGGVLVMVCPPVFSALAGLLATRNRKVALALDCHTGAFIDQRRGWAWSFPLMRWASRRADLVIVTNRGLLDAAGLRLPDERVLVLHDPPVPPGPRDDRVPVPEGPWVLYPASGSPDEPLDVVADTARRLAGEVTVVVTGRQPRHRALAEAGVWLTGFVPDAQYRSLLHRADAILALCTKEHTMQRAGYDALGAGKALVSSNRAVLRETYGPAALYAEDDPDDLAAAVRTALVRRTELERAGVAVQARIAANAREGIERIHALVARKVR